MSFADLGLSEEVLRAVSDAGYSDPTPIQKGAIPNVLMGRDILGCAQTGTGKTASFTLPMIDILASGRARARMPRTLILEPTRELAAQVAENFDTYGKYNQLTKALIIGGTSMDEQSRVLDKGVDVLIATPGRLLDLYDRGGMLLNDVKILVIDEADRMLDMGFIPQVTRIVRATPRKEDRQTLLFSATFTQDIMNLARQWTFEPITVEIEPERVATASVDQKVYLVSSRERFSVLLDLLKDPSVESVIIFANRRDQVRRLYEKLRKEGVQCGMLSGEITQAKRTKTLENFKSGRSKVMVATDVAGRGIHVEGISHVVNYNLPEDPEDYVHRIGRTGRAGATGVSISFASEDDAFLLPDIEALLGHSLACMAPPAPGDNP